MNLPHLCPISNIHLEGNDSYLALINPICKLHISWMIKGLSSLPLLVRLKSTVVVRQNNVNILQLC